jgi:membrane dipeptidase
MNRLGMLIDLAHISRAGFFHVLDVAQGPVCCSQSNCRKLYLHPRGIDDRAGLGFVKDDGPLHPDNELFNADANKLLPGLENEEDLLNLTDKLIRRGFSSEETSKILGRNYLRMLTTVPGKRGQ